MNIFKKILEKFSKKNAEVVPENVIQTKPLLLRDPATGRFISKKAKNV